MCPETRAWENRFMIRNRRLKKNMSGGQKTDIYDKDVRSQNVMMNGKNFNYWTKGETAAERNFRARCYFSAIGFRL